MPKLRRLGAVAAAALLTACSDSPPATKAPEPGPSRPAQGAELTTNTMPAPLPLLQKLGEPFTLDDVRLTVLSVQDPFPPNPQVQAQPGNRLLLVRYEMVSLREDTRNMSDLPSVEVRDTTGGAYRSAHGRLSVVGGVGVPGEVAGGTRMESSAVFEVPASATGLRAGFRSPGRPDQEIVMVALD